MKLKKLPYLIGVLVGLIIGFAVTFLTKMSIEGTILLLGICLLLLPISIVFALLMKRNEHTLSDRQVKDFLKGMRNLTPEEAASVDAYIEKISKQTGITFDIDD